MKNGVVDTMAATQGRKTTYMPSLLEVDELLGCGTDPYMTERHMVDYINLPDFLITLEEYTKI